MTEQSLIPIETVNALELFTGGGLDELLAKIRVETASIVPNVETVTGRKDIASLAYKVARSKTTIDEAGKTLVAEWKTKSAEVDGARKKARDYLDGLRDEIRKPLDLWEAEQARIEQERREAAERAVAAAEAARLAEIERREAEVREREERIAKAEREAREKAEAEEAEMSRIAAAAEAERQRAATEERMRVEAEAKAKANAEAEIARERQARIDAEEATKRAEQQAAQDKADAEARAERVAKESAARAEAMAKEIAAKQERERLAAESREQTERDRQSAKVAHRKKINNAALKALTDANVDPAEAKRIITLIAEGSVPNVSINY